MSQANPLWGALEFTEKLLKSGIAVAQSTVARYLPRPRKPPSQTWRTFLILTNHLARLSIFSPFRRRPSGSCSSWGCFQERRRVVGVIDGGSVVQAYTKHRLPPDFSIATDKAAGIPFEMAIHAAAHTSAPRKRPTRDVQANAAPRYSFHEPPEF
jgi:hypothetical protein